ncbi:PorT family protein [Mucilaginibacter terrenus]|uniref:PorT family protein n=1 Tax=Mucilaginibacter terrenus TaxID=2482727 RepID=A0A3E2NR37_9SPHI|nr:outer membrane beta-barrel protein [Mucilaginibacter terrenus]RFZ83452.1 PorT family protein [Mucilaginibacter terrenus]
MKRFILILIVFFTANSLFAQTTQGDTSKADTSKISSDTTKKPKGFRVKFGFGNDVGGVSVNNNDDTTYTASKAPGFSFGLTFTRFDIGLTTLVDNGSFKLSPTNNFLRYRSWRSSAIGFDVVQLGYRFSSGFRIYTAAGFDWFNLRLRESVTILRDQPVLTYQQDDVVYTKNRLSATYLRVPIAFDFRTHDDADGRRFHFVAGADLGVLLSSSLKQESKENGSQKLSGNYHFAKFRGGPFLRVGYGAIGIFGKYYVNNIFRDSPAQDGLRNFSFGMSVGW